MRIDKSRNHVQSSVAINLITSKHFFEIKRCLYANIVSFLLTFYPYFMSLRDLCFMSYHKNYRDSIVPICFIEHVMRILVTSDGCTDQLREVTNPRRFKVTTVETLTLILLLINQLKLSLGKQGRKLLIWTISKYKIQLYKLLRYWNLMLMLKLIAVIRLTVFICLIQLVSMQQTCM